MILREAEPQDKSDIVALLKMSLGEGLLKKSETVWNYKHEANPFGASLVLLGQETQELVGVRAFMCWQWQLGQTKWKAYRAVDTATHPQHQGKGIFKTLTLQGLEYIQQQQETFIFNTPNNQSRPGYLKMGWQVIDKVQLAVVPVLWGYSFFYKKQLTTHAITAEQLATLCQLHNEKCEEKNKLFTPKSVAYLQWRYENNPMQDYTVLSDSDCYLAMYVKSHNYFKELRVAEVLLNNTTSVSRVKATVFHYAKATGCRIITASNKELFWIKIFGKFGPKLTFRSLTANKEVNCKAQKIGNWYYSLGDLELF